MNGEGLLHRKRREVLQQFGRAAALLFGLLKAQLHAALQLARKLLQHPRCAQQHGHMPVVPTGVHHAGYLRAVGQVLVLLLNGQGVHVSAQRHHGAAVLACDRGHHTVFAHRFPRHAHGAQFGLDAFGRGLLAV